MDDPHAVLGVHPGASMDDLRRARRRLAKALHPDLRDETTRAEAERRMALVNLAYDTLRAGVVGSTPAGPSPGGATDDAPAWFSVEALPVDAFELTLLAAVNLGDVIRAEEPYLLAALLDDPGPCQCLLELSPDAGATTVTVDVAPRHFGTCPTPTAVRDAFVAEITRQATG
ncbi:MAG: DnaJ domain-containing protein [Actinomycetota bacterium]|nr:DnaJ domain-containing protein [Actinomycetota bacterium]